MRSVSIGVHSLILGVRKAGNTKRFEVLANGSVIELSISQFQQGVAMDDSVSRIVAEIESQTSISESTLVDLQKLLDLALKTNDSTNLDLLFNELSSRKMSPSSLVDSLSSAMDSGGISLLASNVYLMLLLSPNSPVFTLFTPMAFLSLLRSVRLAFKKPSLGSNQSSAGDIRGRRKRGGGRVGMMKGKGKNVEDSENEVGEEAFNVKLMLRVLERLATVLGLVHLDRFTDSLRSLVQTVVEIPVMANELCGSSGNYEKLCKLCSRILSEVLKAEHGDQGLSAAEVLKSLTPLILLPKSQARSFALGFLVNIMIGMTKDSDEIKKAVVNLPKYLVHKSPEKAEPRALAVESIGEVVKILDFEDQIGFVDYVVKMSQGKGQFRLLAVDLFLVLMMSIRNPLGSGSDNEVEDSSWGLKCLEALIQRCSDVTAGIRARALTNLSQLLSILSLKDKSRDVLKELMGVGNEGSNRPQGGLNDLLRKRCMDDKAAVRKSSLILISKLTTLLGGSLDGDLLKIVGMACSDPLVSIRKAAISAISEAFRISSNENVSKEWLHSVPPLIADNESSIQEECENLFLELVLDKVSKAGLSTSSHHDHAIGDSNGVFDGEIKLPYTGGVLDILKQLCDGEVAPWVKKICSSLGKKKKLKPKIIIALQDVIRTSESLWLSRSMPIENWTAPAGAWLLLAEVSAFVPKSVDWEFLHHHWKLVDKYKTSAEGMHPHDQRFVEGEVTVIESNSVAWAGDRVSLLQTISNVSVELPPEPAADLAHNILKRLEDFNMHSTEVNAHVKALKTLCKQKAMNPHEADALVTKWVQQILSKASKILDMYTSEGREANKDSNFITPQRSVHGKGKNAAPLMNILLSQAITAVYTVGSLVIVCPSADLKAIVPVLHTIITSANCDPKSSILPQPAVSVKQAAPSLYIQAWLTMGKVCLADGKLAKRYIPLFVQELEKSDSAALRNNIVVMMADFCVRYTALVDCYMAKITKCLRDPCELVRRQTFILLARLLQRDYVKWRGVLFLRFLLSLVDESDKIRQLADFLFGNILKAKAPLLAYNSFVEAIFVLNDCNAHTGRSNPQKSKSESRLFSIRGNDENSRSRRMHIYITLLKQMAPEHLLATFAKVCAEILAGVSDGMLKTDDAAGQSVLQDAFQILSSKEIRIQSARATSESAEVEDDGGEGGASAAAKGRAISQAVRKGLIQNTVPIFIELKRFLESKNSPLIGSLMECLRMLLKDYKNEIDEILVADKQLQKELIYDIEKYETMNAKSTAAEAVAATMHNRSESFLSPGDPKQQHSRSGVLKQAKISEKLHSNSKVASAVADAVAAARARSILKEVNRGASTPPLSAMSVPKIKSVSAAVARGEMPSNVIESLRRRQSFDSDDEK